MMKKSIGRILIGLALTTLFLAWERNKIEIPIIDRLELMSYDARLDATIPEPEVDPRVVIIDIDERSLVEQGHWPWNRLKLAKLVTTLIDVYQVELLGFDVVFAERDSSEELELLETLATQSQDTEFLARYQNYKPHLNPDQIFAQALNNRPVILGYYFDKSSVRSTRTGALGAPLFAKGTPYYPMLTLQKKLSTSDTATGENPDQGSMTEAEVTSYTGNVAELQKNALGGGFYSIPSQDRDGILRRIQLMEKFDGALFGSLSLELARHYMGSDVELITSLNENNREVIQGLDIGSGVVPIDAHGTSYIPYNGRAYSFRYVSATDILNQTVKNPEDLQYVIGIVGTTAAGLVDLRNTPLQQNNYPGVEVHAATVVGILDASFRSRPYYADAADFLLILFVGLLLSITLPALGASKQTLMWLGLSALAIASNLYLWAEQDTILAISPMLLLATGLYMINMAYGYFFESRNKAKLSGLFGQYIPPELVEEMAKDPQAYDLVAKKEDLSVLFTDVRGFTNISEGLDPESLSTLMNELLSPMTRIVHENKGTIDKYMGDAMMAFWGAPIPNLNHASAAVASGLEMLNELDAINQKFADKQWPEIKIGVGVNTGEMNVGNMGSEFRMAYTVLGDAVNLGARVEGLTKEYGVLFIVTQFTAAAAPEFEYRQLDTVRVKGKDEPVTIFEPMGLRQDIDAQEMAEKEVYHCALAAFALQEFEDALVSFEQLYRDSDDRLLYKLYIERCQHFIAHSPGQDWDGVVTFATK
ncbi:MAG: adenylate cyclase [Arenicella sp.]|jgi:adenylate cyclase